MASSNIYEGWKIVTIILLHTLVEKGIITKKEARKIYRETALQGPLPDEYMEKAGYIYDSSYDESKLE